MKTLNDASVDSVVTETMKVCADTWYEVHRVLKPGGHVVVLTSKRAYHRLAAQIEDAGFEIRDQIIWLDQDDIHPCVVARKPLEGNVAENVLKYGVGGINIEECRVPPTGESRPRINEASQDRRYTENGGTNFAAKPGVRGGAPEGRFPANVIHDGSDKVEEAFAEQSARMGMHSAGKSRSGKFGSEYNATSYHIGGLREMGRYGDTGNASRFFYRSKSSTQDRGGSNHPLMSYLCKLVTPPGGVILDPFDTIAKTAAKESGFETVNTDDEPIPPS